MKEKGFTQEDIIGVPRCIIYKSSDKGWLHLTEEERERLASIQTKTTIGILDGGNIAWCMESAIILLALNLKRAIKIFHYGSEVAYKTSLPAPNTLMTVSKIDENTDEIFETYWYDMMLDQDMHVVSKQYFQSYISKLNKNDLDTDTISTKHVSSGGFMDNALEHDIDMYNMSMRR